MNFAGFDLNQLRALHLLLDEAHVARAARRLGITAPAASNALRRLREQFDDPLLVRSGNVMVRSPLAEELRGPVARLMADAERVVHGVARFQPRDYAGEFRIGASDHVIAIVLGELDRRLRGASPDADLRVDRVPRDPIAWLEAGGDLVLGALSPEAAVLASAPLFDDRFVCLVAADHPLAAADWSVDDYAALDHLLITPRGEDATGIVDELLGERGLCRRVAVTVPNVWLAAGLLPGTSRVVTLPARDALAIVAGAGGDRLVLRRPPLALPRVEVRMIWHLRADDDRRHRWLREELLAVARGLPALAAFDLA